MSKKPRTGDEVVLSYNLSTGKSLDSVQYTIGDSSTLVDLFLPVEVLDSFLCDMKQGEVCSIKITDPKYTVDGSLLEGDITLIEIRAVEDCSIEMGSKIVFKKTVKKGESFDCPNELSVCKAEIVLKEKRSGKIIFPQTEIEVIPGTGKNSEAIESAIIRIVPNEQVEVTTVSNDAWIDPTLNWTSLESSNTVMELKLVSFTKAADSWSLSPEEKIARLNILKEAGSEIFKSGRIRFALTRYVSASRLYEHEKNLTKEAKSILKLVYLNEAMCNLKLQKYAKAEAACSKVLKEDPQNVKALFRRAQSLENLAQFDRALNDAKRGLEIEPSNTELRALYGKIRDQVKKSNDQMKGLYSKMMKAVA
jgi:FK506-binding protein 4/5